MKIVKIKELKELTKDELQTKLRDAKENYFKLKIRKETRQLEDMVSR